ncbi:hypothetical protein C2845_PM17G02630 [Panicum miliaceum]|uniref:Uncharacterized protein n=1 Tax=Panicum miliaceum TaxID=4540 RepID=A0A3L6Q0C2_PANMI|nr:hypothetical protein C2845_PM17G02630 [Panicum miliaceum]
MAMASARPPGDGDPNAPPPNQHTLSAHGAGGGAAVLGADAGEGRLRRHPTSASSRSAEEEALLRRDEWRKVNIPQEWSTSTPVDVHFGGLARRGRHRHLGDKGGRCRRGAGALLSIHDQHMSDLFDHSWRASSQEQWIWVPKPALLGENGHPARPEEIQREGWRARRVSRVQPPPPLTKLFAQAANPSPMAREGSGPSRKFNQGGNPKRCFEDERGSGRFYDEEARTSRWGQEARREDQRHEWNPREREFMPRHSRRDENYADRRRILDYRSAETGPHQEYRPKATQNQGNPQISVHDRLSGKLQDLKGRNEYLGTKNDGYGGVRGGFQPKDSDDLSDYENQLRSRLEGVASAPAISK